MVFPGQGSQHTGMLFDFSKNHSEILETFKLASEILGYDLWRFSQEEPPEKLSQTEFTQPLMLTAGVSLLKLWLNLGGKFPALVAGHSLGEYTALVASQAISFEEALPLVRDRGRFMQEAVKQGDGAMAAIIGMDDKKVVQVCADLSCKTNQVLEAVNFNAPGQVVIAGHTELVSKSVEVLKKGGARKAILLPVSAPFHCALMRSAEDKLIGRLNKVVFSSPVIPVVQARGEKPELDPGIIRLNLEKQISKPIPWSEMVLQLGKFGIERLCEVGPGNVLTGLVKRISPAIKCNSIGTVKGFIDSLNLLKTAN